MRTLAQKFLQPTPPPTPLVCALCTRRNWLRTEDDLLGSAYLRYQHSGHQKDIYPCKYQGFWRKDQGLGGKIRYWPERGHNPVDQSERHRL